MKTRIVVVSLCTAAVLVLGGAWMARYRYEQLRDSDSTYLLRINRFTGTTARFVNLQWIDVSDGFDKEEELRVLPEDQLKLITGTGRFRLGPSFVSSLYNGSGWTVKEVIYRIKSAPRKGRPPFNPKAPFADLVPDHLEFAMDSVVTDSAPEWEREFQSTLLLKPRAPGHDSISIGNVNFLFVPEWTIISARGIRPAR